MTPMRGLRTTRPRSKLLRANENKHPEDLKALRELLVEPPTPEAYGGLLPEAMAHASQTREDELSTAIEKPLKRALRDVARRESELFGEILAPTIGTAVRRAVTDALAAMLQRMNQLLERGLSLRSIAWRLEARRTGRPFAEVVLSHTLVYRVEWVVLIHTTSSLAITQVASPAASAPAPDQVSAMLQAISSFVSDAFHRGAPGADLNTLEVGDLTLWVERDPALTLAVAIRGVAPRHVRELIRNTLDRIRALHPEATSEQFPDVTSFEDVRPLLEDCLEQQLTPTRKRAQWFLAILGSAIVIIAAAAVVRCGARDRRDDELRAAYDTALSSAPGIIVTSIGRAGDQYRIKGLRDPRAEPADEVIARAGLPAATLELAPFESLDPQFETTLAAADEAIRALEAIEIPFERGKSLVDPTDPTIQRAAELVNRAHRAASRARVGLCIEIVGDADEAGVALTNQVLRSNRASKVADALRLAGVPPELLAPRAEDPARSKSMRRVTMRAVLRPDPTLPGCPS